MITIMMLQSMHAVTITPVASRTTRLHMSELRAPAQKCEAAYAAHALAGRGMVEAEEKLRQAIAVANEREMSARENAEREYAQELQAAEEHAAAERVRLERELARVSANESNAREIASK